LAPYKSSICSFILVLVCSILFLLSLSLTLSFLPAFFLPKYSSLLRPKCLTTSAYSHGCTSLRTEAFLVSTVSSMEEHSCVLPSTIYPSLNSLDNPKPRLPLTHSTGNAQYHTVATSNIYSDRKGPQPRRQPNSILPTLPSQPARPLYRTSLEARRSHIRSQRAYRGSIQNPILESEHYRAYRSRQVKGDDGDQKWPDDLEDLFLEGWLSATLIFYNHTETYIFFFSSVLIAKHGKTQVFIKRQASWSKSVDL
jgi:hypothetical protein